MGIFTFFVEKMLCNYYVDGKIKEFSEDALNSRPHQAFSCGGAKY